MLIDRELYLPDESWVRHAGRRNDAAVPEEVGFASEPELGRRMQPVRWRPVLHSRGWQRMRSTVSIQVCGSKWPAWYRHITPAMLAAALLAVIRADHPSPKGAATRDESV